MGKDIHVKIVKRNRETNNWEQINLYCKNDKNEIKEVAFFPFRDSEIFDILQGRDNDCHLNPLPISLAGLSADLQKEITEDKEQGYFGFKEVTLADLKLYLERTPQIKDWDEYYEDENDPRAWKTNPIKYFIERIEYFMEFACDAFWKYDCSNSDIKVLYWFDN